MEVFDLLTDKDFELIDKYISAYAGDDGGSLDFHDDVKHILRFWNGAKNGFLSTLMGNQLILERHINVSTPESIIWRQMTEMMYPDDKAIEFITNFNNWLRPLHYETYELASKLIDFETLIDNVYDGDSFELIVPGKNHPIQINKGCKAMKILGKIAKTFSIEGFEDFRLKHSMILNQKKFQGTLCLSIHPLDYMTMSDNDCDWDSCMSWRKPGEVRAGTLEMMNSPYIIVAYLKAEKDMKLFKNNPNLTWNNKRWRQLFVVSPDVITGIKGYPYCDRILEKETFKWLMELINTNCSWCHYEGPITYEASEPFEFMGQELTMWYEFNIMYDDFYSNHTGYFSPAILEKRGEYDYYKMMLSGETVCLLCGESWEDTDDWNSENLICPDCTGEIKCSHCGEFHSLDDMVQIGDDYLCPSCVDYYTRLCAHCGTIHYREDGESIYMLNKDRVDTGEIFYLCDECFNIVSENDKYGPIRTRRRPGLWFNPEVNVIDIDELTMDGFNAFGYWGKSIEEVRKMV